MCHTCVECGTWVVACVLNVAYVCVLHAFQMKVLQKCCKDLRCSV